MRLSIKKAAEILDLPSQTLRVFLQNGKFSEFATATKIGTSTHWTYYINEQRLMKYLGMEKEPTQKEKE